MTAGAMRVHHWNPIDEAVAPALHAELDGGYATIGNFDGVHRGHLALLADLVAWAAGSDRPRRPTLAITFRGHPRSVLGDARPQTLLPLDLRLERMAASGVAHAVVIPFTRELALLEAEHFVTDILRRGLGVAGIMLGWNACFGHNRRGNLAFLAEHAERFGLIVRGQEPILDDHAPISSSRIRHAILAGDITAAARLLGSWPLVTGTVVAGEARGRLLGFPTANLALEQDVIPPDGVYVTAVTLPNATRPRPALTNIGTRPTYTRGEGERRVETWIAGFAGDLYGRRLSLEIVAPLRAERRFADPTALREALAADRQALEEFVASGRAPFGDQAPPWPVPAAAGASA